VQFRIRLRNSGNLSATVEVTDPLPPELSLTAGPTITPTHLPVPLFQDGTISWSGTLAAGQEDVGISLVAEVATVPIGGLITNTAWISDGLHPALQRQVTINGRLPIYLPMIVINHIEER
jgi:hypothetical protein